jgi:N-acetylmuramoyl-L-alanine amidase
LPEVISFASAEKTGIVTENAVNFRANPNTSSKILYQFEKGAQVKVIGSEGEWFKASYNDITGWINGNYVIVRDEKIGSGVVSGSVVNVRRKPDITSEVLAKLTKGTKVEIFEHSGDWYRVLDRGRKIRMDAWRLRENPGRKGFKRRGK